VRSPAPVDESPAVCEPSAPLLPPDGDGNGEPLCDGFGVGSDDELPWEPWEPLGDGRPACEPWEGDGKPG
jgi:hypothetical protein